MNLKFRLAQPADFDRFYNACYNRDKDNAELRAIVHREWLVLLQNSTGLSIIIEDLKSAPGEQLVGCAQGVFITEKFAAILRSGVSPWVNTHITNTLPDGSWPLLSAKGVREANSGDGLSAVMTRWNLGRANLKPGDATYEMCVRNYLIQSSAIFWRGYKIKELWLEVIGERALQEALHSGFRVVNDYADYYSENPAPPLESRPYLLRITREDALMAAGWLANWAFAYQPPQYFFQFTKREQELLRWTLAGASDADIKRLFNCSATTIPRHWRNIFDRVEKKAPEWFPVNTKGTRGVEKRRLLLRYLDEHPEELCSIKPRR